MKAAEGFSEEQLATHSTGQLAEDVAAGKVPPLLWLDVARREISSEVVTTSGQQGTGLRRHHHA